PQESERSAVDTGATPLLRPMESLAHLDAAPQLEHPPAQQKPQITEHAGASPSAHVPGSSRPQMLETPEHTIVDNDVTHPSFSAVDSLSARQGDAGSRSHIAVNESTLKQLSKRLSRLLNPSLSATSLPSLTKVTPQPVLTVLSPSSAEEDDNNGLASAGSSSSSRPKENQRAFVSAAQEMFSQLLSPSTTSIHARSRSHMNLRGPYSSSAAGSGMPSSSSTYAGLNHIRRGSSASAAADYLSSSLHTPTPRPRSIHGLMTSPPRSAKEGAMFLISRFLPPSPSHAPPLSSSAPKITARPQSPSGERPSQAAGSMRQRRLPASLRMTSSTAFGTELSHERQSDPITPTSPMSDYSSNEGPVSASGQGLSSGSSPPLAASSSTSGPWIPEESMSRTQQKLLLQRASSQDNLDQEEMTRRGKMQRDMERIQREYRGIRMTYDPILESLTRCYARRERELREALVVGRVGRGVQGNTNVDRLNPSHSLSSLSVSSM
ncbi:hypothetical protein BGZ75_007531, partial [Mortierella antarctica]